MQLFLYEKTKKIILTLVIILIIVGIIILLFLKESKKKVKPFKVSFIQSINNTNIKGYYLPKDNLTNSIFIKCSVDNCKKCYGNSYNNTCISCLDKYIPIRNENNEIISCIYKPKNDGSDNATLNQSNILNYSNNISENKIESTSETTLINITEIKSELITNMNQNNITENKIESTGEIIINNITQFKTELISEKIIDNITKFKTELITENISNNFSEVISGNISNNISEIKTELILESIPHINSNFKTELAKGIRDIVLETLFVSENITKDIFKLKTEIFSEIINDNNSIFNAKLETNINICNASTILNEQTSQDITNQSTSSIITQTTSKVQIPTTNIIINCNPGYYFPEGSNMRNACIPCSEIGVKYVMGMRL